MTQPDELKPCPFCGCQYVARTSDNREFDSPSYATCNKCFATAKYNMWNTRSTPDQQAIDDVKLLRRALLDEYECVCYTNTTPGRCAYHNVLAATDRPEYKEEG